MNQAAAPPGVDVVGVGINATDTIVRLPRFPALDSKVELLSSEVKAGGQVASAIVACRRWGLSARYAGKIGDDAAGRFQTEEMEREGVEAHWIVAPGCMSQTSFILVDEPSGERTVLWKRDPQIALRSADLKREWISGARALLIDGHDTEAAAEAARWAREERVPVVGDFDNRYPEVEVLLEHVDFVIASKDFPERLTGETNLLKSLPEIFRKFKCRLTAATLGRFGVLAWDGARFLLCPGFRVKVADTTGAGDIFHGAFLYGLVKNWQLEETLEFSCATAALNCTASGARGGIASLEEIDRLRRTGERSEPAYAPEVLLEAARAAAGANS
ncbi:MAG TPA: PfkB family carbohydrate kinase [Candidatus Acidoferrales bacterium]|nr:PfkB family carbohydrate kinase [Candidatus Acidoferrales bacterium]